MPKASTRQVNFSGGEFSPLAQGNVENERYKTGLARCLNYLPSVQGAAIRRPGTAFVVETKYPLFAAALLPFKFSTLQAYVLEFGDLYLRFYKNNSPITLTPTAITGITASSPVAVTAVAHGLSTGDHVTVYSVKGMTEVNNREFVVQVSDVDHIYLTQKPLTNVAPAYAPINGTGYSAYVSGGFIAKIYEIATNYVAADVSKLKIAQANDVVYITHPSYFPTKLSRTAHTSWTLAAPTFKDGPYLAIPPLGTTLTPSAASGAITLTANNITNINGGAGFRAGDVGRLIRVEENGTSGAWVAFQITGFTSTTVVSALLVGGAATTLSDTTAKLTWRLGLWNSVDGYPTCTVFHENRLFFAGAGAAPQRLDGSCSGDYETFSPSGNGSFQSPSDGSVSAIGAGSVTVLDTNAVGGSLIANDVNVIRWMTSDERGLCLGTAGGEWIARPSNLQEAITPTNFNAKQASFYGSADVQAIQVVKASLFVQKASRKLREFQYYFDVDGFRATNLAVLAEHMTVGGITKLAYQSTPQSFVWMVRADGALPSMTYERDVDAFRAGWALSVLGGSSDSSGTQAKVESIAVIPSADGTRDELWVVCQRYVNGAVTRYIEYLTKFFDDEDSQEEAFFSDSGASYDVPIAMTSIDNGHPITVSTALVAHGLSNGDTVRISDVVGMPEVNDMSFIISDVTTYTFSIPVSGASYGTYVTAGKIRKVVPQIEGLNWLEGQTVRVWADGADQPNQVVSAGRITLATPAAIVQVGLPYNSDGQRLRDEAGAADGTAMGKTRRTFRVGFMLYRTLGLKFGMSFDELDEVIFRQPSDPMSQKVPLFSGIKSELISADYDFDNQVCWRQDGGGPGVIQGIYPAVVVQDRG